MISTTSSHSRDIARSVIYLSPRPKDAHKKMSQPEQRLDLTNANVYWAYFGEPPQNRAMLLQVRLPLELAVRNETMRYLPSNVTQQQ
ncbi:hypothetical protein VCRA2120O333_100039 [Vibrio crassostreae]|nr:hypothetical protein VCRA2117O328_70193 [Vibrio crassostreae]CAK2213486.1 hypothetical protein VCRA2113O326_80038 [Vibrio crassostreae]CAK2223648.1 hypothetical protein VCRA2111O320_70038 [Vibrio crassostreae]CAK2351376.1 hypothetical protein VCRA2110O318_60193 [Vibrio crassostreae]CAK2520297.1 hypothetical protein VCRA2110O319_70038 [Vibrio crassostreae]